MPGALPRRTSPHATVQQEGSMRERFGLVYDQHAPERPACTWNDQHAPGTTSISSLWPLLRKSMGLSCMVRCAFLITMTVIMGHLCTSVVNVCLISPEHSQYSCSTWYLAPSTFVLSLPYTAMSGIDNISFVGVSGTRLFWCHLTYVCSLELQNTDPWLNIPCASFIHA